MLFSGPNDVVATVDLEDGSLKVKGVAWGGGGQGVNRVDVSLDGGEHFTRADLIEKPIQQRRRQVCLLKRFP